MILPTEKIAAERVNPRKFVIYSPPKMGKTTLISQLDNCLTIDLEKGSAFLNSLRISIDKIEDFDTIFNEIKSYYKTNKKYPYEYVAVDTITKLEEWCEGDATKDYKATIIGSTFKGTSVLELANGAGYFWLREAYKKWIEKIERFAPNIILVGHVKDKFLEKNGKEVSARDLDLTGKIKQIACAGADAIGYMYRDKEGKMFINFKASDEVNCGSRCNHLKGREIHIADPTPGGEPGDIISYWDRIYLP